MEPDELAAEHVLQRFSSDSTVASSLDRDRQCVLGQKNACSSSSPDAFCDGSDCDAKDDDVHDALESDLVGEASETDIQILETFMMGKTIMGIDCDLPKEWQGTTSVMVRNLSYMCTPRMFLEELIEAGFDGLFDYFYAPVNSLGFTCTAYAFVNFLFPHAAYRFYNMFDSAKMRIPGSKRRLEVSPSHMQRFNEYSSHIERMKQSSSSDFFALVNQNPQMSRLLGCAEEREAMCHAMVPTPWRTHEHYSMLHTLDHRSSPAYAQSAFASEIPLFCHQCGTARYPDFKFCDGCFICFAAHL
eukprot:TRINITY_DN30923_c0_g1_i1.p1 TRINITY_DN30923_c0_g1~~TRINITY_DN30923_c0_g1_i1.p1  ORF type:complete len:301 (-),score=39.78 TRINITY_DN30923_c0_g1_i1:137-1039(-)